MDRLLLAGSAALAAATLALHPRPFPLLVPLAAAALAVPVLAAAARRWPAAAPLRDLQAMLHLAVLFSLCGPVLAVGTSARWDAALAAADLRLFGALPERWRGLGGRPGWLVDLSSAAYFSYYLLPPALVAGLWRDGRRAELDRLLLAMALTLLLSYGGYFALPATGPRVAPADADRLLGGGAPSRALRAFLTLAEVNLLDAFPSGHTALSLVLLHRGWRLFAAWRVPLALVVGGIVFSTVYLSLHYVVDLAAGALLAAAVPFLLPPLERLLSRPPAPR
ncbi:MAG: phosphatase PAP2 family protein [Deltaproteobacteria bacterium]|nr:phosphatase PAP2 family protein [Deltaproteobacteria bacterium]